MVFVDGPEEQGWWERSGVLAALDRAFVDHHGRSRPGRELVARARGVDQVVEVLERYRAASTGNRPEGKEAS